jgi:hypothetical protein
MCHGVELPKVKVSYKVSTHVLLVLIIDGREAKSVLSHKFTECPNPSWPKRSCDMDPCDCVIQ